MTDAHSRKELLGIQFLRGMAALLVLLDHAEGLAGLDKYLGVRVTNGFMEKGFVGVELFFVLSGFIIVYVGTPRDPKQVFSPYQFLERRFVRIIPFLWFCVSLHLGLRYLGRGELDLSEYVRSFFLWPVGTVKPNQVWTLRHEFLFYMLFACQMHFRTGNLLLMAYFISPVIWWWGLDGTRTSGAPLLDFLFTRYNLFFAAGYIAGKAHINGWIKLPSRHVGFHWYTAIGFAFLCYVNASFYSPTSLLSVLVLAAFCVLTVLFSASVFNKAPTHLDSFGKLLGDASYSIYLTHDIFISGLLGVLTKYYRTAPIFGVYILLVSVALTGGIAIHKLIELPLIGLLRRLQSNRSSKRTVALNAKPSVQRA